MSLGLPGHWNPGIAEITDANSSASPFTAAIMVGLATLDDLNKANAKLDSIRDQSKEYVDEAGKTVGT